MCEGPNIRGTEAILKFNLSDEESKSDFNYALRGKKYCITLFNLKNTFTRIFNDKDFHTEEYSCRLQDKLSKLNLSEGDIREITEVFYDAKNHICEKFFEELNEIDLEDSVM